MEEVGRMGGRGGVGTLRPFFVGRGKKVPGGSGEVASKGGTGGWMRQQLMEGYQ